MAYGPIVQTGNVMAIKEQEYGIGSPVQTTVLTSCITVVGRVQNQDKLLAIHLVLFGNGGDAFDILAADEVKEILTNNGVLPNNAWMVGQTDFWGPGQPPGYNKLIQNLGIQGQERHEKTADDKAIKLTFDNSQARKFRVDVIG